jgi:REP element-mobilizing transposase RayT
MVQGIGRCNIFPSDDFKGYYLSAIARYKQKFDVKLLAFCVMGNHAHALVKAGDTEVLSLFMRHVNTEYAKYYNRMKNRVGYVFRDRYKSETIKNSKHLVYCLAYIQNNPVKAGLVAAAADYPFSSYTNYLNNTGIVDFSEAANHYDTSPSNITAIMQERPALTWLEHDDKQYENAAAVLTEIIKRHKLDGKTTLLADDELLKESATEIHVRSGLSFRKISALLNINREKLRRLMRV